MGLSEWPEHFRDDPEPTGEIVEVVFDEDMLVKAKTDKAIGLSDDGDEVAIWIPISQIDSDIPERGEWIEGIRIPEWLAEEKGLEW